MRLVEQYRTCEHCASTTPCLNDACHWCGKGPSPRPPTEAEAYRPKRYSYPRRFIKEGGA